MSTRVVLVYTHDSIGLGEDGPTHQPIEHLTSLRAIPNMRLWRPCDAAETAVAWTAGIERHGPTALISPARRCHNNRAPPSSWRTSAAADTSDRLPGYAGVHRDRDRVRGRDRCGGGQQAQLRRPTRAPGLDAFDGAFDAQDEAYRQTVLPRGGAQATGGRGGSYALLVALRGRGWPGDRHRSLRCLREVRGGVSAVRLHGREYRSAHKRDDADCKLTTVRGIGSWLSRSDQRLRPHRTQRVTRAVRGEAHGGNPDRGDQ